MAVSKAKTTQKLSQQALDMSLSVPFVMTQRMMQMATADWPLSTKDKKEFTRMGSEKVLAFGEAWFAMAAKTWQTQFMLAQQLMLGALGPNANYLKMAQTAQTKSLENMQRVMVAGVAPIHAKTGANAKRLKAKKR